MTELVFPQTAGMAWGMTKSPLWASRVQKSVSGKRQAIGYMAYPGYKYTVNFNVLREYGSFTEMEALQGFFNTMRGQVDTFRFVDPVDAAVVTAQTIGTGNGTNKLFQLVRTFGGFVEPVQTPNLITSLRKAAVAQTNPTHYSVGPTGIITFVTAPTAGQVIDWTGTYYWRCAFTQDTIDLINDGLDIWKTGKITFETVKQ
jgi:uncharacterized protein (TIGR02217 family)